MSKQPRLTHVQEIELCRALKSDNQKVAQRALNKLVTHNLGLVHKLVNRFPLKNATCSYDDLFQEGVAGLIHGIHLFDCTKGYRLSTYVYRWIQAKIQRYYQNHGRSVRVPVHIIDASFAVAKEVAQLTTKLGRTPTVTEVKELRPDAVDVLVKTQANVSLNSPVGDDSELADLQGVDDTEKFETCVDCELLLEQLKTEVSSRDYRILLMRYGLGGYDEHTLSEISQEFGITKARVSQVEHKMVKLMRTFV